MATKNMRTNTKTRMNVMKNREPMMMSNHRAGFPWKTVLGTTAVAGATAWYFLKNRNTGVGEFVRDHLRGEEKERKGKRHYNDYEKNDDYSETYSGAY